MAKHGAVKIASSFDLAKRELKRAGAKRVAELAKSTQSRMVQDPSMTDAEFWYRKSLKPNNPRVGLIKADINLKEFIGGFWRYRDRTEAQTMAAARFKGLYESSQLGGPRAADYERPIVDTSFSSTTLNLERGEMSRRKYREAVRSIGMRWSNLVERVVIYDVSQRRIAKAYGYSEGGAGRREVQEQVYLAMDALAVHFHL